jgi:hypothetical protein
MRLNEYWAGPYSYVVHISSVTMQITSQRPVLEVIGFTLDPEPYMHAFMGPSKAEKGVLLCPCEFLSVLQLSSQLNGLMIDSHTLGIARFRVAVESRQGAGTHIEIQGFVVVEVDFSVLNAIWRSFGDTRPDEILQDMS